MSDRAATGSEVLFFGDNGLDLAGRCLLDRSGRELPLTRSEFALLEAFLRSPGRVLTRDHLLGVVSGREAAAYDRSIDVLVSRLRRKVESDPKQPDFIVTVPGGGYKFVGKISASSTRHEVAATDHPIPVMTTSPAKAGIVEGSTLLNAEALRSGRLRTFSYLFAGSFAFLGVFVGAFLFMTLGRNSRPPPPPLSIVVLPFVNLSGDSGQDYLADVLTDELTTSLSRMRQGFVIARSTAFTYKARALDVREVGAELGVRYVLEGSEQHNDSRVRVSAQLIDAETGRHVWADRFDADRADFLQMQDEIVTRLARTLQVELVAADAARIAKAGSTDLAAEDLAMRCEAASFHGGTNVLESTTRETGYVFCEQALRIDERNIRALSNLAFKYAARVAGGESLDRAADLRRADDLASRALSIDSNYFHALFVKALVLERQGRIDEALLLAERCLDSNPSFVICIFAIGRGNVFLGNPERAIEHLDRALRLSPRDNFANLFYQFKAQALWMLGRDGEAIESWQRSLALNPEFPFVQLFYTAALASSGRMVEARDAFARYLALPRTQARTIAQVKQAYPVVSNAARWAALHERLLDGARKAGMPED